jgi:hypothetical protein
MLFSGNCVKDDEIGKSGGSWQQPPMLINSGINNNAGVQWWNK